MLPGKIFISSIREFPPADPEATATQRWKSLSKDIHSADFISYGKKEIKNTNRIPVEYLLVKAIYRKRKTLPH